MAKKDNGKPKYIKTMWRIFGALWLFIFLFFTFLSLGWLGFMPSFEELENPRSLQASEVLSADGEGYIPAHINQNKRRGEAKTASPSDCHHRKAVSKAF